MQEYAGQAAGAQAAVGGALAVAVIPDQGVTGMGAMHANLVAVAGVQAQGDQAQRQAIGPQRAHQAHPGARRRAIGVHAHHALARRIAHPAQRRGHSAQCGGPFAQHHPRVGLAHLAGAEQSLGGAQGAALFGHQHAAGCAAIQPVHQLQESLIGARRAQPLYEAGGQPAAAVHRQPRRFVNADEALVLVADAPQQSLGIGGADVGQGAPLRGAQRRQAHAVALAQPRHGPRPPAVQPHLTTAQKPVDSRARHAL